MRNLIFLFVISLAAQTTVTAPQIRSTAIDPNIEVIVCLPTIEVAIGKCSMAKLGSGLIYDPVAKEIRSLSASFQFKEELPNVLLSVMTSYNLAEIPKTHQSLRIYRNGIRLRLLTDYSIVLKTVNFALGSQPQVGDVMIFEYIY